MRSFVLGFYGHGNVGDELLSRAAAQIMYDALHSQVVVATVSSPVTRSVFQDMPAASHVRFTRWPGSVSVQNVVHPGLLRTARRLLDSDLIVMGGGGILSDWEGSRVDRWLRVMRAARRLGKTTVLLGIGAGPFFDGKIVRTIREILNNYIDLIVVRDLTSSRYLLETVGVTGKIHILPDLVYYLQELSSWAVGARNMVVMNMVPFFQGTELYDVYVEELAKFARWLSASTRVWLLPLHRSDALFQHRVAELADSARITELPLMSPIQTVRAFSAADVVIGTRFHSLVIASMLGKLVQPIVYHHKSRDLAGRLGLQDYLVHVGDGSQWVNNLPSCCEYSERFQMLVEHRNEVLDSVRRGALTMRHEARRYVDLIKGLVDGRVT
ncbi:MAG: polysaccharide pyruvyl transferase family protein [Candidatus Thorarchaeota archaeon]